MLDGACQHVAETADPDYVAFCSLLMFLDTLKARVAEVVQEPRRPSIEASPPRSDVEISQSLLAALNAHDPQSYEHTLRTEAWCRRLCARLGLSTALTRTVTEAARLHDIGKALIPTSILLSPNPLGGRERLAAQQYTNIGANILDNIPSLKTHAVAVRALQERWDGNGAPAGLRGNDIPLASRIIAVTHVFDLMISPTSYHDALAPREAIHSLHEGRGKIWDPLIVNAMTDELGVTSRSKGPKTLNL